MEKKQSLIQVVLVLAGLLWLTVFGMLYLVSSVDWKAEFIEAGKDIKDIVRAVEEH